MWWVLLSDRKNVAFLPLHAGLAAGAVLEGGDGADSGGAAEQWQDHLRQRHRVRTVPGGPDTHCRLQHAQGWYIYGI